MKNIKYIFLLLQYLLLANRTFEIERFTGINVLECTIQCQWKSPTLTFHPSIPQQYNVINITSVFPTINVNRFVLDAEQCLMH